MDSYSVELRIVSHEEQLDLDAITKSLGIVPNNTRRIGEYRSKTSVWNESMWGYTVYPEHGEKDWGDIENALESLLGVFMPLKEKISEYAKMYHVVIWSAVFTSSFGGGAVFSPRLLKGLGEFGIELSIDTYCSKDSADE